ncbi:unnamed protein product [Leptidea sinapis]|uniref:Uncharacterized protein n=1 Tax=Leptidea sinapis TaxID=189913 RepID=A0A5E4QFB4_9NEOP|nr:unnamed protein product [Leptidea sinapis]
MGILSRLESTESMTSQGPLYSLLQRAQMSFLVPNVDCILDDYINTRLLYERGTHGVLVLQSWKQLGCFLGVLTWDDLATSASAFSVTEGNCQISYFT